MPRYDPDTGIFMAECKVKYDISTDVEYNIRNGDFSVVHTHTYWEIVFIVEGAIDNRIGNETTRIPKNCAVLIKPDDAHSIRIAEENTMYINLEVRSSILKTFLDAVETGLYERILQEKNLIGRFSADYGENVNKFVRDILLYGTAEEEQRGLRRLSFRIVFDMLPDVDETLHEHSGENDVIKKTVAVMEQEENVRLKLGDICKIVGYSESYLIRLFRSKLGTTPNREFTKIKMRYAAKLLRKTDYSVERVALMVGYSNKGHFYKLFGEEYGMLPYEYKKMKGERG